MSGTVEAKHTPGPWKFETVRTSCGLCHTVGPFPSPKSWRQDKPSHACVYDDYPPDGGSPELVANARLMAAAPDMLAALKAVRAHMPDYPDTIWQNVDEAIARAEGRQP